MKQTPILDMRSFMHLFESCCPDCELLLYSADGLLIWLAEGPSDAPRMVDLSTWQKDVGDLHWRSAPDGEFFAWPVTNEQWRVCHYLIVRSSPQSGDRKTLFAKASSVLETISQSLARQQQIEWVGRLSDALYNDRFKLYSQRIVPLHASGRGQHFEILLRLIGDDGRSVVAPRAFLPAAEHYQMMPAVDRWVLEHTLSELSDYVDVMVKEKALCSINLSGQTLNEDFAAFATEQFRTSGFPPSLICFEVTETAAIENLTDAQKLMHDLRGLGCQFALDDFGSGLSSFAYLRSLPVDYLKLDGSFVAPIAEDEKAAGMLEAINRIGHILDLRTVAEFVESPTVLQRLRTMGVDYAQGYSVGRPQPLTTELDRMYAGARKKEAHDAWAGISHRPVAEPAHSSSLEPQT